MVEVLDYGCVFDIEDVDVKDLLEMGKVVMERSVFKEMIEQYQSDLIVKVFINGVLFIGLVIGQKVFGQ